MRNILIGLSLGVSLTAGFSAAASFQGPTLRGESGRLSYSIVVEGVVECTDPWVSIPERMIECDSDPPDDDSGPERVLIARSK